jgi:hypothetical protein
MILARKSGEETARKFRQGYYNVSLRSRKGIVHWIRVTQQGSVACISEYANEASGSVKHVDEYFHQLRIRQLFRRS